VSGQPFTTQPPSAVQQMPGEKAVPSVHVSAPRQETELLPDKPMQVGVLTSNFHLFRAVQIGKKQGFDHLSGVASSTDPVLFLHLCVRESLAILKDKFMGNM
ncbi:MAG: hypothetical protein Q4F29_06545, partial [Lachnospiraceae bacterium]|nr:hypothetical protein [Lachnospiraceae bacterium]